MTLLANKADGFLSDPISLNTTADGYNGADIAITFNSAGGSVQIYLFSEEEESYKAYTNLVLTESVYYQLRVLNTNKIKIGVGDGATDVTIEV